MYSNIFKEHSLILHCWIYFMGALKARGCFLHWFAGFVSDDFKLSCQMQAVSIRNNWSINAASQHMDFFGECQETFTKIDCFATE